MHPKLTFCLLFAVLLLASCQKKQSLIEHAEWKKIFDASGVKGSFLLLDEEAGIFHSYDSARCRQGFLPASTFKIPNSLISLETGALPDTGFVIAWDSISRWNPDWNRAHTLRSAFQVSCVPCYQQLAHLVGVERMRHYTRLAGYGDMRIDTNSISNFWLEGPSRISQYEQIDFLRRLYHGQLPFKPVFQDFVRDIMIVERTPAHTLRAKTGWAVVGRTNIGWWVGWVEKDQKTFFFASNIEAPDTEPDFGEKRTAVPTAILKALEILR